MSAYIEVLVGKLATVDLIWLIALDGKIFVGNFIINII